MQDTPEKPPRKITLECPKCGRELRTKEKNTGRTVPCPGCSESVLIPPAKRRKKKKKRRVNEDASDTTSSSEFAPWYETSATNAEKNLGANRKRTMQNLPAGWNYVRFGLSLISISTMAVCLITLGIAAATLVLICLLIAAIFEIEAGMLAGTVCLMLTGIVGLKLVMDEVVSLLHVLICAGYILLLFVMTIIAPQFVALLFMGTIPLAGLGLLVGWCCCLAAPNENCLRYFMIGALSTFLGAVICYSINVQTVFSAIINGGNIRQGGLFMVLSISALVLMLLSHLLFVLFLRSVGSYFGDQPTAEYMDSYLFYQGGIIVLVTLVGFAIHDAPAFTVRNQGNAAATIMLYFVLVIFSLIGTIWFFRCVEAARSLIRPFMRD
ncbi:hypothetical protein [Thalassoglobus polymorphus]|uniref:Uncharacterized protein n=1 Tax=Thalassoglobus polymorphus TaxID=2527994 RepID=A0A517QQ13_9PLAN|nr:hypothetical protein [Thalassoglobus polymorphus]QDT33729.1 hypothetical protein Mal48_29840 [Thalassoglobus polymorphus]